MLSIAEDLSRLCDGAKLTVSDHEFDKIHRSALSNKSVFRTNSGKQGSGTIVTSPEFTMNVQDVAEGVLRAANDTSPTLRFPAGSDSVAIAEKRAGLSEQAFLTMMRQSFGLPQQ
jgi:hypothetical protein